MNKLEPIPALKDASDLSRTEADQKALVKRMSFKPLTPNTITDPKLFLDELLKTKERGYAIAIQELSLGLKTMAVPILNGYRKVSASFGVSYPMNRGIDQVWEEKVEKSILTVKEYSGLF